MTYDEWNRALLGHFFEGKTGEVVFCIDPEVLAEASGLPDEVAKFDFLRSVRGVASTFEGHLRYASRRSWLNPPQHLPHLAAFVLAWTQDQDVSANNYRDRIAEVLGTDVLALGGSWSLLFPGLWRAVRDWAKVRGQFFRADTINSKPYVGIPLAHAILTPGERRSIEVAIREADAFIETHDSYGDPDAAVDQVPHGDLVEIILGADRLRTITRTALEEDSASLHSGLIARRVRSLWANLLENRDGSAEPAAIPNRTSVVRVVLSATTAGGAYVFNLRLRSASPLPERSFVELDELSLSANSQTETISRCLEDAQGVYRAAPGERFGSATSDQFTLRQSPDCEGVLVLPLSREVGGFIQASQIEYGVDNLILIRNDSMHLGPVREWAAGAPESECRGWRLFRLRPDGLGEPPDHVWLRQPLRILVEGGIAVASKNRGEYFSFAPPQVRSSKGDRGAVWRLNGEDVDATELDSRFHDLAASSADVAVTLEQEGQFLERHFKFVHGATILDAQALQMPWRARSGELIEEDGLPETRVCGAIAFGTHLPRACRNGELLYALGSRRGEIVGPLPGPVELTRDWAPPTWWVYEDHNTGRREFHFTEMDTGVYPDIAMHDVNPPPAEYDVMWARLIAGDPQVTEIYVDGALTPEQDPQGRRKVEDLFLCFCEKAEQLLKGNKP